MVQELCKQKFLYRKKIKLLQKLTIVIPSYQRQDFILRQVAYWGGEHANVVILDGSPESLSKKNTKVISMQNNIKYLHRPISIYSRLNLARKLINTPYAVLLGDDEFYLKRGLSHAIRKLDADPSLVACIGQSLSFRASCNGRLVEWGAGYPHHKYEVTQDSPADRLIYALSNYNAASCYAVMRRREWLRSYTNLKQYTCVYAGEIQQAITAYGAGKLSSVDAIYWLRSGENKPVSNPASWDRQLSFADWWSLPRFKSERLSFVQGLSKGLMLAAGLTKIDSKSIALKSVKIYIESIKNKRGKTSNVAKATMWVRFYAGSLLKKILPLRVFNRSQKLFRWFLKIKNSRNYGNLSHIIQLRPTFLNPKKNKELSELVNIEKFLLSFYKARFSRG